MHLFYDPNISSASSSVITLGEEESRHIARVLRLKAGDTMHIGNGRGDVFIAVITNADPRGCRVTVSGAADGFVKRPFRLTVGIAPTKSHERFEWFLEKAAEVGIDRIVPLACARSERRIVRIERGRRILAEAAKQSLKAVIPQLDDIMPLNEFLSAEPDSVRMIACCDAGLDRRNIGDCVKPGDNVTVLIGPEGDFSPGETALAVETGFIPVTLGGSRLRTETAALAAVMFISFINPNG